MEEEFETVKIKSEKSDKRFLWSKHPKEEIQVLSLIEKQFKDKVNAKSVPSSVWNNIFELAKTDFGPEMEVITSNSIKALFRGLKTSYSNYKEGKISKKPRHFELMHSILSSENKASLSLSGSPILQALNRNLSSYTGSKMEQTPMEGRIQLCSDTIQRIATIANPTPTMSMGEKKKHQPIHSSFEPCILCGKIIKHNDQEHYLLCFENLKDQMIIASLENAEYCNFCKSNWIAKHVSAEYKINHMKSCADSFKHVAKYLKSLKCENNPDTPLISDDMHISIQSKVFEFLKPAPKTKISRKKLSPLKSNLKVTDDSSVISRKSAVLNQLTNTKLSPESISPDSSFPHQSTIRFLGESKLSENNPSLFSMGCGTIPIKKNIDSIEQINIDQNSPSNSQNRFTQLENILGEFEKDKSHLLYDFPGRKRSLHSQEVENISEISGPGDRSYVVISPKKLRVENDHQLKDSSMVSDILDLNISSIYPSQRRMKQDYSDFQSIHIHPTQKNLSFSAINSIEFPPLSHALKTDCIVQTDFAAHTEDCGIQADNFPYSNRKQIFIKHDENHREENHQLDGELISSGNICLQVSELEDERIKGKSYDSDQDLFTPDCAIPDELVSQDLSRNFDLEIEVESNFSSDDCHEIFEHVVIPAHLTNSPKFQNAADGCEQEPRSSSDCSEDVQNISQVSIASTVIPCTQMNLPSTSNLFGELAKKKKRKAGTHGVTSNGLALSLMPNYDQMELAELQNLGQQYGLKASGKPNLVKKLVHIWKVQNCSKDVSESEVNRKMIDKDILLHAIQSDEELYQKILCYEPLDLDVALSSISSRCDLQLSKRILLDFFDEQGINVLARRD